jgi:P4 family phage/plasmid primase-like protien
VSIHQNTESYTKEITRAAEEVYLRSDVAVEIRAFGEERGWKKTYSGWFDNREAFVAAALKLEQMKFEVYATLNACSPDMLARAYNKLAPAKDTGSTSDENIVQRLWIPVDFDPQRASGVSATDEEKAAEPWKGTGRMIGLEHCPWNEHRDNAPFLGQLPDGRITARCHHNSCEYDWHEFREFYDPKADRPKASKRTYELTDTGNGERFAAEHGGDVCWVAKWGKHMVWNGRKWEADVREDVTKKAQRTAKGIHADAAAPELDVDAQKRITRHAISSQSALRIRAMIDMAKGHMIADHEEFDADLWFLNCQNGTVDLRTGELREHNREDLITKATPVEYDPKVATPVFDAFLKKIVPDPEIRAFLQRAFGMALSGEVRDNVLIILHGTGSNGKSTLMDALMEAFGDYAISSAPDLLMSKANSHPTELADLFGARLVSCMESEEGRRLNEGLVKQLTGRDRIKARRMREDFWEFDPTHSVFFGTNHKPEIRGTDHAIWRRLKLVPFEVTIPDAEQDKDLTAKLRKELPGILAWAVQGCLEWQRTGLQEPKKVTEATQGYRADMDVIAQFIEDMCVEADGVEVGATRLHIEYQTWCRNNGEEPLSQRKFGGRIGERGHISEQFTSGPNAGRKKWVGIGLKSHGPDPDDPDGPSGLDERDNGLAAENAQSGVGKGHDTTESIEARRTRPKSDINHEKTTRVEGYAGKRSSSSNSSSSSSPTAAEEQRILELVRQGMSAKLAREEVMGDDNPLADEERRAEFLRVGRENGYREITRENVDEYLAELEAEDGDTPKAEPPSRGVWESERDVNSPAMYDELPINEKISLRAWVRENVEPRREECSSYLLKHVAERDLGSYVGNGEMRGAMLEANYVPVRFRGPDAFYLAGPKYHHDGRLDLEVQALLEALQIWAYFIRRGLYLRKENA